LNVKSTGSPGERKPMSGKYGESYMSFGFTSIILQDVPLATEPGISLIILTPIKILQRNLNSSTFFLTHFLHNEVSPLQISLQYPH